MRIEGKITIARENADESNCGHEHTDRKTTTQVRTNMPTLLQPALEPAEVLVASPAMARPGFYRPELDGLRFFSFLAVFISHAYLISPRMFAESGPIMAEIGRWALAAGHCGYAAVADSSRSSRNSI